jgi:hypothetical protein
MTAVYAIATFLGVVALVAWALTRGLGTDRSHRWDPEAAYGSRGRAVVAGTIGFGLGGMSATFSGAAAALAVVAAIAGAIVLAVTSARLGPTVEDSD